MALKELTQTLEIHGTNPVKWPANSREQIEELLNNDERAMALKKEFDDLEKSLDQLHIPDFAELKQYVRHLDLPPRRVDLFEKFLTWLLPTAWLLPTERNYKNLWRPAVAACLPLMFGIILGNYYTFGINISIDENEFWEDQLLMLALSDHPEETF